MPSTIGGGCPGNAAVLFFSCFPLKTERADASLGRFLSQEHSPKTSAPGPALPDLTLCGPGGSEGPGVPSREGGVGGVGVAPAGAAGLLATH